MLLNRYAGNEYKNIDRDLGNENYTQCRCIRVYSSLLKRRGKVWNRSDRMPNNTDHPVSPQIWAVRQGLSYRIASMIWAKGRMSVCK